MTMRTALWRTRCSWRCRTRKNCWWRKHWRRYDGRTSWARRMCACRKRRLKPWSGNTGERVAAGVSPGVPRRHGRSAPHFWRRRQGAIGDGVLESGNGKTQTPMQTALRMDAVLVQVHRRETDRMGRCIPTTRTGTLASDHFPVETHTLAGTHDTGNLERTTGTQRHRRIKHLDVSCQFRRTNPAVRRARITMTRRSKNHRRRRQTRQFEKEEKLARAQGDAENECVELGHCVVCCRVPAGVS